MVKAFNNQYQELAAGDKEEQKEGGKKEGGAEGGGEEGSGEAKKILEELKI